jgi:hypothetical protein
MDNHRDSPPAEISSSEAEMLLTEQQLAARHQMSVKTLRNARVKGDSIPFVKIGRLVRYRMSDVARWESARLRTSTSDRGGGND